MLVKLRLSQFSGFIARNLSCLNFNSNSTRKSRLMTFLTSKGYERSKRNSILPWNCSLESSSPLHITCSRQFHYGTHATNWMPLTITISANISTNIRQCNMWWYREGIWQWKWNLNKIQFSIVSKTISRVFIWSGYSWRILKFNFKIIFSSSGRDCLKMTSRFRSESIDSHALCFCLIYRTLQNLTWR